jgi:uracil-DNA glycosylase family 4
MQHEMSAEQIRILQAMDVGVWVSRDAVQPRIEFTESAPVAPSEYASVDWDALAERVSTCVACRLHESRIQTVFGVGDRNADWLIVGEAPGGDEDRQGEPFVGRAGQMLNKMLRAIGLQREQVYIANTVKCRPPGNRDPQPDEVAACAGYLDRQIEMIRPRLILAVGKVAARNLLQDDSPVGKLRGRAHPYGPAEIPLIVTYHPSYLLRNPEQKRKSWADLCLARSIARAD